LEIASHTSLELKEITPTMKMFYSIMKPLIWRNVGHQRIKLTKKFGDFIAYCIHLLEVYEGEIFGFLGAMALVKLRDAHALRGCPRRTSGESLRIAGFDNLLKEAEKKSKQTSAT